MYYVCYLAISIGDAHVPDVDFYFGREVRIIDNCALGRCCCTQRERGGRQAGKGTDSDNSYAVVMVRLFRSPPPSSPSSSVDCGVPRGHKVSELGSCCGGADG